MAAIKQNSNDTIHLWHATSSSDHPGPIERCCHRWLDESERQRAERFRVATSRNQNIVGRGMARRLLSGERVDPRQIRFELESNGKPFVTEPSIAKRPFNIAHTDGLVICAVGSDQHALVGTDVERLGRRTDPELATRYFSRPEIDYLRTFDSPSRRQDVFLRIWTLKESFIKAIGTGLQTPLADFAFDAIDSPRPRIQFLSPKLESNLTWTFFCHEPRPGFIGAVAVACQDPDMPVDVQWHRFDDLVAHQADDD